MTAPTIYDPSLDEARPATQEDIDFLVEIAEIHSLCRRIVAKAFPPKNKAYRVRELLREVEKKLNLE